MTYEVLLENKQERGYTATLLGWPKLSASGASKVEVLGKLRANLQKRLAQAEVVTMEVDVPRQENPWQALSGVYRDHPLFDELLAEIEADRKELNQDFAVDLPELP